MDGAIVELKVHGESPRLPLFPFTTGRYFRLALYINAHEAISLFATTTKAASLFHCPHGLSQRRQHITELQGCQSLFPTQHIRSKSERTFIDLHNNNNNHQQQCYQASSSPPSWLGQQRQELSRARTPSRSITPSPASLHPQYSRMRPAESRLRSHTSRLPLHLPWH